MGILDEFVIDKTIDKAEDKAIREGLAIQQMKKNYSFYRCKKHHRKTGKVKTNDSVDILEILNVVH